MEHGKKLEKMQGAGIPLLFQEKTILKFKIQDSRWKNTYRNIYQYRRKRLSFNYGQGTNNFTIEVNDNSMNVQLQGSDNVCEYTKVN